MTAIKIAAHYSHDRRAIARLLGRDPGLIAWSEPGWGDPHRGGLTVTRVRFESGVQLAWKPRSVKPELLWAAVIAAAERRLGLGLVAARALDRGAYGWCEWIAPDREPVDLRRVGAIVALLDLLEVRDVHLDNVVLAHGQVVLVDAETIAHPRLPGFEETPSIILTGALPWPPGAEHRATLTGMVRSEGDLRRIVAGYRAMHRLVRGAGQRWIAPKGVLGSFRRSTRIRVLLRPTRDYARRGQAPLEDPAGIGIALSRIREAESEALGRGDVPLFETQLDGTELRSEGSVIARRFFGESGWSRIVRRIRGLDEADEKRALSLLRSCLRIEIASRG